VDLVVAIWMHLPPPLRASVHQLAVWALGNRRLSETGGRRRKALSGAVMLSLGLVLLLRPGWLI
jgi:hypothetical protein